MRHILLVFLCWAGLPSWAAGSATAVATVFEGYVTGVNVVSPGSGYRDEPAVTLTGGGGSGATAKAFLSGDRVALVLVLTSGTGYLAAPTVTIDPPPTTLGLAWYPVPRLTVEGSVGSVAQMELASDPSGPWVFWTNVMIGAEGKAGANLEPSAEVRFYRAVTGIPMTPAGFVQIPAGSFEMGDAFNERGSDQRPVHPVQVSLFFMGQTEVTKARWDGVRTWALTNGYTDLPAGGGKGPDHPAQNLNWFDVVKWCNAASEQEGLSPVYRFEGLPYRTGNRHPVIQYTANGYRLPSEAEWEKAARGGLIGNRFPWGNTIQHEQANYYGSSTNSYDLSPSAQYHPDYATGDSPYTSPVGTFAPNGYGLHDMAGNVFEWCNDWHGRTYYSESPGVDPRGPDSGSARVIRGGSWINQAFSCRVSYRLPFYAGVRSSSNGFRLVRSSIP